MEKQGVFYAVSVGPGDPELLTRQACRVPGSTDLDNALPLPGTKVVMKSGKAIYKAAAALERHGLLANAGMVADCGLETEQVYTDLRHLPEEISYFATIVAD